ncbi:MAG: hypothetical protein JO072_01405 [Parafilimonas sp.]|nr:hypothetical protein [Parafilimonas sp.]
MKIIVFILLFIKVAFITEGQDKWFAVSEKNYTIHYTEKDTLNMQAYEYLINNGEHAVFNFFSDTFHQHFDVFVYYTRAQLDTQWQKEWQMPNFKSECWMVASGVARKLDMISPMQWSKEACEHKYSDTLNTQRLITHELVHVYHGQLNKSPDFSDVQGIDWFVEGLATYVSGQLDSERLAQVKAAVISNEYPKTLDDFWTGKLKYGLSGSVVMFIDKNYGREKLKQLLPFNKKQEIVDALGITEQQLLADWKSFVLK